MSHTLPLKKFALSSLGLLAIGAICWFSTRSRAASPASAESRGAPAVPITMTPVQTQNVEVSLSALGTVTPVSTVTVASRVAGVLTEVHYQEGQRVHQGDLLAVIDPRPYQAAVTQAQGQLARDQALLQNAQIDVERYKTAYAKHAIPEQQVATENATVLEDQGIVKLDEGNLAAAQVNLDYTQISSPINGRVGLREVDAGNIVQANGTTALAVITQLQPMTVVFTLSQENLPQVMAGMRDGQSLKVEAFNRGQNQTISTGKLLTIDNQVDPETGTFRLKAIFPNERETLWPGAFVTVRLITEVQANALTVPARAVQVGPNGNYLYIVKSDHTAEMRDVTVARTENGVAVISQGVAAGDQVVVDGQYRLEQGSRVAPQASAGS